MTLVPWTPILRGPQLGKLGGYRKGAGGQGIGFRSMTAAAELPVTFGQCFYRLEARLLGWWGSSAAQGSAPGVSGPCICSCSPVGATLAVARPSLTGFPQIFLVWVGEALGPPAGGCACQESTLIRLASGQTPSPFEGEGLRAGGSGTRPYGELRKRFHTFVGAGPRPARQDSHRKRWLGKPRRSCGTAPGPNFCKLRAQWPGRNRGGHSDFARRNFC